MVNAALKKRAGLDIHEGIDKFVVKNEMVNDLMAILACYIKNRDWSKLKPLEVSSCTGCHYLNLHIGWLVDISAIKGLSYFFSFLFFCKGNPLVLQPDMFGKFSDIVFLMLFNIPLCSTFLIYYKIESPWKKNATYTK